MPLKVKSVLLNIVGETGIQKLIKFFRNSENRNLQKHAAILLSSLIDNGYFFYFIIYFIYILLFINFNRHLI